MRAPSVMTSPEFEIEWNSHSTDHVYVELSEFFTI